MGESPLMSMDDDDVRLEHHPIENPGSVVCDACGKDVPLPKTDPYLVLGGRTFTPQLQSIRCPHCRNRVYLMEVDDETKARRAESDALSDEGEGQ
jgi:DNA-directed RNA polymerase subunit RPC12/RpoP